ncbi:MAG: hypothetical protein ACRDBO_21145 [Lachnospiraceae bacterium]
MKRPEIEEDSSSVVLFEELYILTFQNVYRHINLLMDSYRDKKELLIRTYLNVYVSLDQLPEQEKRLEWICRIADQLAESKFSVGKEIIEAAGSDDIDSSVEDSSPVDETSIYLDIEERISQLEEDNESNTKIVKVMTGMQGIFSACLLIGAVTALTFGVGKVREQLEFMQEPLIKPLEDKEGNPADIKLQEERIIIAGKVVYLSDTGQVLYSLPLEETDLKDTEISMNPEIQKQEGWTYYLPSPERDNSSLSDVAPFLHHTLYRMNTQGDEIEIIDSEVEDFTFWEDNIYVSQFGRIQRINIDETFDKLTTGIYPQINHNDIYLYDTLGRSLINDSDGNIQYGDCMLHMSGNRVEEVYQILQEKGDTTYYFKSTESGLSKEIYRSVNGREELFVQVKERIDSFCLADDWLYFSAYIRKGGSGAHYSELYRKSLIDDTEPEKIHDEFTGRIYQMYFSSEMNKIYASYIPKDWKSNHGVIAVISMSGQMSYLDDTALRSTEETTGNDMLEFVMVYDNEVYCFWKDCSWKPGEAPVAIWRKALAIPDSSRIQMDD